jgi:GNAT superfamily N-acetyltransferase
MKLEALHPARYADFYRFNEEIFPTRVSVPARFQFQILDNPLLAAKDAPDVAVVAEDDGAILGQVILQPIEFHHDGTRARGYMGVDLFVRESARNRRAGGALAFKIVRTYSPFFCVTISEAAEKVFAAIGIRTVGAMQKFLWVRGARAAVGLATAVLGGKARLRPVVAPATLAVGGASFVRAAAADVERVVHRPWSDGRLEFDRAPAFLAWRFFGVPNVYVTYLREGDPSCFFVVRAATRRGLSVLSLVDYRTAPDRPEAFVAILLAVKQLARAGGFDGVATASSVAAFTTVLKRAWFFEVGSPVPVLANLPWEPKSLFVTMADADSDLRFDEAGPVFG